MRQLEGRQVVGARHGVVHEARRQQLAGVLVVMHALQQRLPHPLRDTAMHLALDDHRVDDVAEIVGGDELDNLGRSGLRIDLDLTDVAAGREGEIGRIVKGAFLQSRLHAGRQVVGGIGGERHLEPGQTLVGARDLQLAALDDDVALVGLHQMRRDLLGLGLDLVERLDDRRHADGAGARPIGAHAHLHLVGVAMDDVDAVDGHAEPVGDELRECGLVALAMTMRTGHHLDGADRIDAHLRRFPQADAGAERANRRRRRDAAGLDITAHADAAFLAASLRLRAAGGEAGPVGGVHRRVQRGLVVAGVVVHDHRRLVGEGADEVDAAQFRRRKTELPRRRLHRPFQQVCGLRPARAAIGIDRHGVGIDRAHIGVDRRNGVLARQQRRIEIGRDGRREQRHVGAEIGDGIDLQRRDPVVGVEGHLDLGNMIAAMGVGHEGLGAVGGPFHRHPRFLRRPETDDLFRIDIDLRAEAATDIGGDNPQLVFRRHIIEGAHDKAGDMRVLAGGVAGVVVLG